MALDSEVPVAASGARRCHWHQMPLRQRWNLAAVALALALWRPAHESESGRSGMSGESPTGTCAAGWDISAQEEAAAAGGAGS